MQIGAEHSRIVDEIDGMLAEFQDELQPLVKQVKGEFGIELDIEDAITSLKESISENRKVVIGVVGQVKAGKSTLLNALIFDGENQLTTDVTPATARLTTIKHDPTDARTNITFYTKKEWQAIKKMAAQEVKESKVDRPYSDTVKSADEKLGDEIDSLLGTTVTLPYYEDNDPYIHKDGKYTDIVKFTEMYVSNPYLEELDIVDTPGLNDVVESRVQETYKQLDRTDAIMLLPSHGKILDSNDLDLTMDQIREKGIGKIIFVIPQYDTYDKTQREEMEQIIENLSQRAEQFAKSEGYGPGGVKIAREWFSAENAVKVSAMAYSIARKKLDGRPLSEEKNEDFYLTRMENDPDIPTDDYENLIQWSGMKNLESMINQTIIANKTAIVIGRPLRKLGNDLNAISSEVQRRRNEAKSDLEELSADVNQLYKRKQEEEDILERLKRVISKSEERVIRNIYEPRMLEIKRKKPRSLNVPSATSTPGGSSGRKRLAKRLALEIRMEVQDVVDEFHEEILEKTRQIRNNLEEEFEEILDSFTENGKNDAFLLDLKRELRGHFEKSIHMNEIQLSMPEVKFSYNWFQKLFGVGGGRIRDAIQEAVTDQTQELREVIYPKMKDQSRLIWNSMIKAISAKASSLLEEKKTERQDLEDMISAGEEKLDSLKKEYERKSELFEKLNAAANRATSRVSKVISTIGD